MNALHGRLGDVVILGGGPAGTATALTLAHAGYSATILERSHYDTFRVGETLPSEVQCLLIELGVWDQFLADGHLESPGIVSSWGRPELYDNDSILNPYGPGWHVDRCRFDAMLARAAEAAGAEVRKGAQRIRCERDASCGWHVEALVDGIPWGIRAAVLVDATGRKASEARRIGGHRIVYDRLVGLIGRVQARIAAPCDDRRTLIEAVKEGWWYSTRLPDGGSIAAFMTDADLLPRDSNERSQLWRKSLHQAPHTRARLGPDVFDAEPWVAPACTSRLTNVASPGWVAVGDAAAAFDPLSQQGVAWALESGLKAAHAVVADLGGIPGSLEGYARWVASEFVDYLLVRNEYYGKDGRWPGSTFWRRRHTWPDVRRDPSHTSSLGGATASMSTSPAAP